jgi:hypothetical protein
VPGAKVALAGQRRLATLNARSERQHQVLGRSVADGEGRFQLGCRGRRRSRTTSDTLWPSRRASQRAGLKWTRPCASASPARCPRCDRPRAVPPWGYRS